MGEFRDPRSAWQAPWARYSIAVLSVAGGLMLRFSLAHLLGAAVPYITLFPAVMFAAWFGGLGPGIVAMALSLLATFGLILPPYFFLLPATAAEAIGAAMFTAVSLFISALNEALRRSRASAEARTLELSREIQRRGQAESELARAMRASELERDRVKTILASIGDAVVATDEKGALTFLNPVAEDLTGFSSQEALGRPISEIFRIRNERTMLPAECPVQRVIREKTAVRLANHTVLLHKDGREIPIEDSAAPIGAGGGGETLGVVLVFRDVTARRQWEEALEVNEGRLKLALDAGKIGVWDWDISQNRIEWSDLVYEIHGVGRGNFPGRVEDFSRLVHAGDRARVHAAIQAALEQGAPYEIEFRVVHPNGEIHWVETTARVFRDAGGQAVRMLGSIADVTARHLDRERLTRQWHMFDTALSNSPDAVYVFDLEGRFTYANRFLLNLLRLPLDGIAGKNFFDLGYPTELAQRLQRQIQQVIGKREPLKDDAPFTAPGGETRHYEYIFVPILDEGGNVEGVAGATRDVTERNGAEQALRKSEERLTLALASGGGVGTWDWDMPNGRIYCGAEFARLFSLDPENAAAGIPLPPFVSRIHAEDRARVEESMRRVLALGGDFAVEFRVVQPDGTSRWIYARGHCHLDEAGNPGRLPGVAFDISERKRIESDLRSRNDELRRLNRELEEFAYVASHDLQEPLRMINVYTQLIMRNLHKGEENLDQYAAYVHQGIAKMQLLIRDLLTFSHAVHTLEPPSGTADLSAALSAAMSVLESTIGETGAVITAEPLPHVRGETSHISHVFQNLLSNSLKYVTKGVPPRVNITARREGHECVVTVRDNGIGFEPHHAERIFKLFKRLHTDEYPGTGLGLAICKRIVERYGGRVWAESNPGEGAAFHFTLPGAG